MSQGKPSTDERNGMAKLNDKQRKFIDEYMKDHNASQAALRAGYSKTSHTEIGAQLLCKTHVKDEISRRQKISATQHSNLRDKVIKELAILAFSDMADYGSWNQSGFDVTDSGQVDPDKRRAISEVDMREDNSGVKMKIKKESKIKALELLGKHFGIFEDKREADEIEPFVIHFKDGDKIKLGHK